MATRMQQRRGTAAEWTAANPVLAAGEIGYESDTGRFKFGDGTNTWANLTHFADASAILGAAPEALDTLAELAAAVNNDPDFYTTVTTNATAIATNTADIANNATAIATNTADMIAGDETLEAMITAVDTSTTAAIAAGNTANNEAIDALETSLNASIALVSSDAADAFTLASSADDKADTANAAVASETTARLNGDATLSASIASVATDLSTEETARIAGDATLTTAISDEATARATAVSDHNLATTSVHGIADTSVLATDSDVASAQAAAQTYADGLASNYDAAGSAASAQTAAESFATSAVSTHEADTLGVHGIADTADLALLSGTDQTFSGDITIGGNLTVSGTTVTVNASDLSIRDNMIYLNQAGLSTITGAVGDGTNVVYTTDAEHGYAVGDFVTVTGVTPSSFDVNSGGLEITAVTATTFTVLDSNTDTYVSGGSARGKVHSNPDLGWAAGRYDGSYAHAGIFRDATDGVFKFFDGYVPEPDESVFIDTADVSFALAPLSVAALTADTVTPTNGIVFSDGTQVNVGVPSITPIAEKTASYQLSATSEKDTIIEVNSSSATTLTIPDENQLNFPVGTTLDVIQTGTGQVTIAGAAGVTVNATPGLKLRAQWSSVTLLKRGSDNWLVFGDTSA